MTGSLTSCHYENITIIKLGLRFLSHGWLTLSHRPPFSQDMKSKGDFVVPGICIIGGVINIQMELNEWCDRQELAVAMSMYKIINQVVNEGSLSQRRPLLLNTCR